MKRWVFALTSVLLGISFSGCGANGGTGGSPLDALKAMNEPQYSKTGVTIIKPKSASSLKPGPVVVCIDTRGYVVEPAKNGVNEGKGHHHLIIDAPLPDLKFAVPKDDQHIHMGDGSKCKTLQLGPGNHTITALFARGNHVPYDPPVTDTVFLFVGHSN
ncbi:MAG: DUF4399 domain-containing protein [Nitrospinaceae bacterium]